MVKVEGDRITVDRPPQLMKAPHGFRWAGVADRLEVLVPFDSVMEVRMELRLALEPVTVRAPKAFTARVREINLSGRGGRRDASDGTPRRRKSPRGRGIR